MCIFCFILCFCEFFVVNGCRLNVLFSDYFGCVFWYGFCGRIEEVVMGMFIYEGNVKIEIEDCVFMYF